jgi:hypothetical protein
MVMTNSAPLLPEPGYWQVVPFFHQALNGIRVNVKDAELMTLLQQVARHG